MATTGQRIVVYTVQGDDLPYTTVYGDEEEAMHQLEQCKLRHPEASEVLVLDSGALLARRIKQGLDRATDAL